MRGEQEPDGDAVAGAAGQQVDQVRCGAEDGAGFGDEQRVVAAGLDGGGQPGQLGCVPGGQVGVILGVDDRRRPAALAAAVGHGVALPGQPVLVAACGADIGGGAGAAGHRQEPPPGE